MYCGWGIQLCTDGWVSRSVLGVDRDAQSVLLLGLFVTRLALAAFGDPLCENVFLYGFGVDLVSTPLAGGGGKGTCWGCGVQSLQGCMRILLTSNFVNFPRTTLFILYYWSSSSKEHIYINSTATGLLVNGRVEKAKTDCNDTPRGFSINVTSSNAAVFYVFVFKSNFHQPTGLIRTLIRLEAEWNQMHEFEFWQKCKNRVDIERRICKNILQRATKITLGRH